MPRSNVQSHTSPTTTHDVDGDHVDDYDDDDDDEDDDDDDDDDDGRNAVH